MEGEQPSPPPQAAPPRPPLVDSTKALVGELHSALLDRAHLLGLELQQAGIAVTQMVMFAVMAALLLASAWLALMVGLFMGATAAGLHWAVALLIVLGANLGGAGLLWWQTSRLTETLTFPATMRTLRARAATPARSSESAADQP